MKSRESEGVPVISKKYIIKRNEYYCPIVRCDNETSSTEFYPGPRQKNASVFFLIEQA
jgi:hypothetical protein